jgi:hypothetical protein
MPFLPFERIDLKAIVKENSYATLPLNETEMEFFEDLDNLRQLQTKLVINPPKIGRVVETANLIFLINEDFEFERIMEQVVSMITPPYRILVDFSFLLENYHVEDPSHRYSPLKLYIYKYFRYRFVWSQMSTALPIEPNLIRDKNSKMEFLENLPIWSELPRQVERAHQNQSNFQVSGYNMTKILTCSLYITKMK